MLPGRVSLAALCQIHHLVKFDALSTAEHSMTQSSPPLPSLALHQPGENIIEAAGAVSVEEGDSKIFYSPVHSVGQTTPTRPG